MYLFLHWWRHAISVPIICSRGVIATTSPSSGTLHWRHNGHGGVSNHQPHDCLLSRLFRRRSKKASKLRVTGLCVRNSPGTGEFPAQMASNAENVSIWWRHHDFFKWKRQRTTRLSKGWWLGTWRQNARCDLVCFPSLNIINHFARHNDERY